MFNHNKTPAFLPVYKINTTETDTIDTKAQFEKDLQNWLEDSKIGGDKKEAVRRIKDAYQNNSDCLILGMLELTTLPPQIGNLTNLTWLILWDNKLEFLPPEIGNLTNLTWLFLDNNQLKSLPPEVGKLTNLERLYLSNNPNLKDITALTNVSGITSLKTENTSISIDSVNTILKAVK